MFLSDLKVGDSAYIINMSNMDVAIRKKLLNLGFLPNAKVDLLCVAPLGDPLAVVCANNRIALRKSLAQFILVKAEK
ncbi:ferrous iron transport protein A [Psychromonas sp. CNPT3]|uniref:FeoA family protein n=1 Tax=Psychromonas sp. CNPT3 TaxID=314282 RepID=UPI00006E42BA|nr:FeoA family protein [Psychromonas sp. CNPT3]AGH80657.1 ferrous iron transport protein A [Psychromonas sp. CNPT3]